jgi:hypothetical protein
MLASCLHLYLPSGQFPLCFPAKTLYEFLLSHATATVIFQHPVLQKHTNYSYLLKCLQMDMELPPIQLFTSTGESSQKCNGNMFQLIFRLLSSKYSHKINYICMLYLQASNFELVNTMPCSTTLFHQVHINLIHHVTLNSYLPHIFQCTYTTFKGYPAHPIFKTQSPFTWQMHSIICWVYIIKWVCTKYYRFNKRLLHIRTYKIEVVQAICSLWGFVALQPDVPLHCSSILTGSCKY